VAADDVQELDAFKEGEDEGEDGRVLDAAAAAAAATAGGADTYFQQEDEALQYYDAEGNLVQADYEADPLANWKAGGAWKCASACHQKLVTQLC
jgi:hypothetical protein